MHAQAISGIGKAVDPKKVAARLVSRKFECRVDTIEDLAAMEDPDGFLICAPTNTLADLMERVALLGKPVKSGGGEQCRDVRHSIDFEFSLKVATRRKST
ncbi:MAG: hypothetical protein AAGA50_05015 [Pseudomonadota bacterium]